MKKAFTLAEMLIVIAIIGVIATLVLPSLMADYQKRVLMTQLKKSYAEISQAGLFAIAVDGVDKFKYTKAYKKNTFLSKFFKKAKSCGSEINECINDTYVDEEGNNYNVESEFNGSLNCIKTKAGYALCLNKNAKGFLDVNGQKGPNKIGEDAFPVRIGSDGSIDEGYSASLKKIIENDWEIE